ncbi:hypothetical protein ALC62_10327, partial [Cyphomyrmex costatus]
RQLPTDLSNGTCRSGAMSFCTFLLSTESSRARASRRRRMADGRAMFLHRAACETDGGCKRWKL